MEEQLGAQYAIQIAVYTLKERCKNLQQRVDMLEEENRNLHISLSRCGDLENSLSEIDKLRQNIAELTEHNNKLDSKCKMVIKENDELWKKLTKMTKIKKNLDTHLSKISDSLAQHSANPSTLIRSKTFTQVEPQTKILQKNLEQNDKISLELEDISLKLADSIFKQKNELNILVSEITGIRDSDNLVLNGNFGYTYDEAEENEVLEEVEVISKEFNDVFEQILIQKSMLLKQIKLLEEIEEKKKNVKPVEMVHKDTNTDENIQITSDKNSRMKHPGSGDEALDLDKICPMCSKLFLRNIEFEDFQRHVESHFKEEFEVL